MGHDAAQGEGQDVSEAPAFRAGPVGAVEGEELGKGLRELTPASLAGAAVVIAQDLAVRSLDEDPPVSFAPRDLQALAQARPVLRGGRQPIHIDLDRSLCPPRHPFIESRPGGVKAPRRPRPYEAAGERPGPEVLRPPPRA